MELRTLRRGSEMRRGSSILFNGGYEIEGANGPDGNGNAQQKGALRGNSIIAKELKNF